MSPSWPSFRRRIVMAMGRDRTTIVHQPRAWRPFALAETVVAHTADDGPEAVRTIAQSMANVGFRAQIAVILSAHWLRFAVIPAARALHSDTERLALVHHVFDRQYGALARDWSLLVAPSSRVASTLACGISAALVESLRRELGPIGPIVSIRPALMDVFNAIRRFVGNDIEYLAIAEPGRVTLGAFRRTGWQSIVSRAISDDRNGLVDLLDEQTALQGKPGRSTLWLHDPDDCINRPTDPTWLCRTIPHVESTTSAYSLTNPTLERAQARA